MYILLKVEDYFCVKNCIFPVDSRKQIPNTLWLVKLNERAKSLEWVGKKFKSSTQINQCQVYCKKCVHMQQGLNINIFFKLFGKLTPGFVDGQKTGEFSILKIYNTANALAKHHELSHSLILNDSSQRTLSLHTNYQNPIM